MSNYWILFASTKLELQPLYRRPRHKTDKVKDNHVPVIKLQSNIRDIFHMSFLVQNFLVVKSNRPNA